MIKFKIRVSDVVKKENSHVDKVKTFVKMWQQQKKLLMKVELQILKQTLKILLRNKSIKRLNVYERLVFPYSMHVDIYTFKNKN